MADDDAQARSDDPEPGVLDLLVGAFWGRDGYRAAARRGLGGSLAAVVVMLLLITLVLGVQQYLHLGAQIAAARDSAVWLMPRLNIAGGVAEMEAPAPRTLATERFVVVLDPRDEPEIEPAAPGDTRTRFVVLRTALVVFTYGSPVGNALPWQQLNSVLGPVSVDGPELVAALDEARPKMVLAVSALRFLGTFSLVLFGGLLAGALYRVVFYSRPRLPEGRALIAMATLAGVPGVSAAGIVRLLGLGDATAVATLFAVGGAAFFVAAAGIEATES